MSICMKIRLNGGDHVGNIKNFFVSATLSFLVLNNYLITIRLNFLTCIKSLDNLLHALNSSEKEKYTWPYKNSYTRKPTFILSA